MGYPVDDRWYLCPTRTATREWGERDYKDGSVRIRIETNLPDWERVNLLDFKADDFTPLKPSHETPVFPKQHFSI
ncbi:hypothetical protein GCM10028805_62840 [Spirosoma harenae]